MNPIPCSHCLAAGRRRSLLRACGETAKLPPEAGIGPTPQLPAPNKTPDPDREHRAGHRLADSAPARRRRTASR